MGRQTNRLSDLDHRAVGDLLGAFGAHFEEAIYVLTRELGSSLAERREPLDDPLGEQVLLVVAADLGLPAPVPVMTPVVEEELVESANVAGPGKRKCGLVERFCVRHHAVTR